MASEMLFGGDITPSCKYCELNMQFFDNNSKVLCVKKGVVLSDYKCRGFIYDPIKRIPKKPRMIEKMPEESFAL